MVDDPFLVVADDHDELACSEVDELIETVSENEFLVDFDRSLRFVLCEQPKSRSLSGSENTACMSSRYAIPLR